MIQEQIKLLNDSAATLETYILDDGEFANEGKKRKAVVICPGGGYTLISKNEGEPVAAYFNSLGYHAFVLTYSVKIDNPFPQALKELAASFKYIIDHAASWLVDSEDISVIGFSAGGHLALSLGVFADSDLMRDELGFATKDVNPKRIILGYPTVSLTSKGEGEPLPQVLIDLIEAGKFPDFRGPGVKQIMTGKLEPTEDDLAKVNLLNHLHKNMSPVFVFGTYEDIIIPVSDLTDLAKGLSKIGVPCELHLFQKGNHGMSVANNTIFGDQELSGLSLPLWKDLLTHWIKQN